MSKDKARKKDKLKHLDLFGMMLNQSHVFRDMVEHFQSAWTPKTPSVVVEAAVTTRKPVKKQAKSAKAVPVAKPAAKRATKKSVASSKAAPAAVKPSPRKAPGKTKTAASPSKPVTPRKNAARKVTAGRTAKKK